MNSFDDLRKKDRENAARELLEEKAHKQRMESAQRMYGSMVQKCLRDLGEYWFGSTNGLLFSTEHYKIKNNKPGEWELHQKKPYNLPSECYWYEDHYILVRYTAESDSKGYLSVIRMTQSSSYSSYYMEEIEGQIKSNSKEELHQLMVGIGERYKKPTVHWKYCD